MALPGEGVAGPLTIGHVDVLPGLAPVVRDPLSHRAPLAPLVHLHALCHRGAPEGVIITMPQPTPQKGHGTS